MFLRQGLSLGPDSVWLQGSYCLYHPRIELKICETTPGFLHQGRDELRSSRLCGKHFANRTYVSSPFAQCGGLTADNALPLRTTPQSVAKLRSPSDFTACGLSTCRNLTGISESFLFDRSFGLGLLSIYP